MSAMGRDDATLGTRHLLRVRVRPSSRPLHGGLTRFEAASTAGADLSLLMYPAQRRRGRAGQRPPAPPRSEGSTACATCRCSARLAPARSRRGPARWSPRVAGTTCATGFASAGRRTAGVALGTRRWPTSARRHAVVDAVLTHDPALAPPAAVRNNEFYVSQYLDLTPVETGSHGTAIAVRQNMPGPAAPWMSSAALGPRHRLGAPTPTSSSLDAARRRCGPGLDSAALPSDGSSTSTPSSRSRTRRSTLARADSTAPVSTGLQPRPPRRHTAGCRPPPRRRPGCASHAPAADAGRGHPPSRRTDPDYRASCWPALPSSLPTLTDLELPTSG